MGAIAAALDGQDKDASWTNYRDLIEAFPAGVVICDRDGHIVLGNAELFRLFEYDRDELLGQPIEVLLPEGARDRHPQSLQNYMANPESRIMGSGRDLQGRCKSGRRFPVEIGLNPIIVSGRIHVLATVADISYRKRLEENFESIFNAAPVGMLITGSDGRISHINGELLRIFGYARDQLIGEPVEKLLPARHRESHPEMRTDYLNHPERRAMGAERDLTGLHSSGREIPVEIGLNPIVTERGLAVIAAIGDVTERKRSERKLKQLNADLDEFTYVASHDLKSPLRGICSLIEWIEEDLGENVSEEIRNNLDRIHVRIGRMEKLVEDLLSYARSGRGSSDAETLNLGDLVDRVITFIDPPEGFTIKASGFLSSIQSASTPLETVLRNILSNSIKHHDGDAGTIEVNIQAQGNLCIFDILDDGPGVPANARERVFKLFQSLSDKGPRSGVGLAVCKRLVEAHGGTIEIIPNKDGERGACFRFTWPRFARSDIND